MAMTSALGNMSRSVRKLADRLRDVPPQGRQREKFGPVTGRQTTPHSVIEQIAFKAEQRAPLRRSLLAPTAFWSALHFGEPLVRCPHRVAAAVGLHMNRASRQPRWVFGAHVLSDATASARLGA